MPTYEYKCSKCGDIIEVFHGITEDPKIKCANCKIKMERLITGGAGFILKGGGWPGKQVTINNRIKNCISKDPDNKGDGSGRMLGDDP